MEVTMTKRQIMEVIKNANLEKGNGWCSCAVGTIVKELVQPKTVSSTFDYSPPLPWVNGSLCWRVCGGYRNVDVSEGSVDEALKENLFLALSRKFEQMHFLVKPRLLYFIHKNFPQELTVTV